jgi:hypothetical protein
MVSSSSSHHAGGLTSDSAVDDGTIFELDRDRLVVELHQKPFNQLYVLLRVSISLLPVNYHSPFPTYPSIQKTSLSTKRLLRQLASLPFPSFTRPSCRILRFSTGHRFPPSEFEPFLLVLCELTYDLPDELHIERRSRMSGIDV